MGFLRRLRGASPSTWPPPGPITTWPSGSLNFEGEIPAVMFDPSRETVEVVGEGSYQGTLDRLAGGRTSNGARDPDHVAILMLEPSNPYDPNAVRVVVVSPSGDAGTIGSLSREDAVAYRPVIERLAADGKLVACRAKITGGWDRGSDDRGSFGVRLSLRSPSALMKELDAP